MSGSELAHAAPGPAGVCANCGSAVASPYCGACGQRDLPHNPSARVLVGELWDTFGTFDGKLVRTVALLAARPGALTVEWLRGRRGPYLRPLSLYLTVSAAFFAVLAATEPLVRRGPEAPPLADARYAKARQVLLDAAAKHSGPRAVADRGLGRASAEPAAMRRVMFEALPRMMFVLVPLFALVLARLYRRRGLRYPAHLYCALHVFAFTFGAWTVLRLVHAYAPGWVYAIVNVLAGVVVPAYLILALRRVYGGRLWATAARAVVVAAISFAAFLAAALTVAIVRLGAGV